MSSSDRQPRGGQSPGRPFALAGPAERDELLDRLVTEARFVGSHPQDRAAARRLATNAAHLAQQLTGLERGEYSQRLVDLASGLRSVTGSDIRQLPAMAAYLVVIIELIRRRLDDWPNAVNRDAYGDPARTGLQAEGIDAADEAFRALNAGTSRLVQLLADELVPLEQETIDEIEQTIAGLHASLPALAHWGEPPAKPGDWLLGPPFGHVGVRSATTSDFEDIENLERMRRSFDFLAPQSLALRKEAAILLVDSLLAQLRRQLLGSTRASAMDSNQRHARGGRRPAAEECYWRGRG